ncbi:RNA polymerase sigma factor [Pedobacter sp. AW31-3R]|uniref:RNA polymerase sigma factor n=1 Tax=Pedobacter sp. AW31-3R TaxID=3445781 RepID=UPI003FA10B63
MKEKSDKALIHQITESNYSAFSELYDRYWKLLFSIALKKTGKDDDAFDIVQELFIDFWQRRKELKVEKSVETYLVSSLFFKVFMHFRRKGLEEKHLKNYASFLEQVQNGTSVMEPEDDPEFIYTELVGLVAETIEEMPEKMREVFNLKYKQSLSIVEIATTLGISSQTVKNQLANAMLKLRKAVNNQVPGTSASLFIMWFFS